MFLSRARTEFRSILQFRWDLELALFSEVHVALTLLKS